MQLGLCPEAAGHLQELKDNLIAISNDLLDNVENLSSMQIAKLRQERCAFTLDLFPLVTFSYIPHSRKFLKGFIIVTLFFFFYNYASTLYLEKKLQQHIPSKVNSIWIENKICC